MPSTHPITKNGIRTLLRQRMFHIDAAEVTFSRRGFVPGSAAAQGHLEQIGTAFLSGYHAAIDQGLTTSLAQILSQTDAEYRGFAFEGAGMGLGLLDSFSLRRGTRWQRFVDGIGRPHRYVVHVGLGWVVARLPWLRSRPEPFIAHLHPLLKWLVMDGYGFHEGYFHWQNWSPESLQRPRFRGYASRAFDQGLGRCLWFVAGGDVGRLATLILAYERDRQPDLWSGVGLACAYAGKPDQSELEFLMHRAQPHLLHFQQGVTFGAEAREDGNIPATHTEQTCQIVLGCSAAAASQMTYAAIPPLPNDVTLPNDSTPESPSLTSYEIWRSQIRGLLKQEVVSC